LEQVTNLADNIRDVLQSRFADIILGEDDFRGQQSFDVKPEAVYDICQALFEDSDLEFRFLSDITSVDWYGDEDAVGTRFEVIYNLFSLKHKYRLLIKARLPESDPEIRSLTPLWQGANWLEREVWDLMGIKFTGHPDLTKILTPDDLKGHPLRRDFPLTYEQPQFSWNKNDPPEVIK
jgi:NADH-quinone oxidoreductase subunit C